MQTWVCGRWTKHYLRRFRKAETPDFVSEHESEKLVWVIFGFCYWSTQQSWDAELQPMWEFSLWALLQAYCCFQDGMAIAGAVLHQLALFHWHSSLLIMVLSWMTLRTTQLRACTCIHSLMMERKRCKDLDFITWTCVLITYSLYSCINWSKVLWSPHLARMLQTSLVYPSKLLNEWMLFLNNSPSNSRRK